MLLMWMQPHHLVARNCVPFAHDDCRVQCTTTQRNTACPLCCCWRRAADGHTSTGFPVNSMGGQSRRLSPRHGVVLRLQRGNPLLCAAGNVCSGFQLRHLCRGIPQLAAQLLLGFYRCRLRLLSPCVAF